MKFPPLNWHARRTQLVAQRQTLYKRGRTCISISIDVALFGAKVQYVHKILPAWSPSMFAFLWLTCFGFQAFGILIKMAMRYNQWHGYNFSPDLFPRNPSGIQR